jgi:BlaI family penicillinase repressor
MHPAKDPKPTPRPTDAELEILTVLWSRGPSTVRSVHEVIAQRRGAQYTTVLKMLQIMDEKGLVKRDESERAHVYRASQPKETTQRQLAGDLLHRAFDNSAKSLLLGALSSQKTSKQELDELRAMLDEYESAKSADAKTGEARKAGEAKKGTR